MYGSIPTNAPIRPGDAPSVQGGGVFFNAEYVTNRLWQTIHRLKRINKVIDVDDRLPTPTEGKDEPKSFESIAAFVNRSHDLLNEVERLLTEIELKTGADSLERQ